MCHGKRRQKEYELQWLDELRDIWHRYVMLHTSISFERRAQCVHKLAKDRLVHTKRTTELVVFEWICCRPKWTSFSSVQLWSTIWHFVRESPQFGEPSEELNHFRNFIVNRRLRNKPHKEMDVHTLGIIYLFEFLTTFSIPEILLHLTHSVVPEILRCTFF